MKAQRKCEIKKSEVKMQLNMKAEISKIKILRNFNWQALKVESNNIEK